MSELDRRPAIILLVEDDLGDQELTRRALAQGEIDNELHIVNDGEEALDYLFRRGQFADPESSPRPDLVLLDLNMPKVDGKQVLEEIRKDKSLRRLSVVVLTTSSQEHDILLSYDLGIQSFITKPVDMKQFMEVVQTLKKYWFKTVALPPNERE